MELFSSVKLQGVLCLGNSLSHVSRNQKIQLSHNTLAPDAKPLYRSRRLGLSTTKMYKTDSRSEPVSGTRAQITQITYLYRAPNKGWIEIKTSVFDATVLS